MKARSERQFLWTATFIGGASAGLAVQLFHDATVLAAKQPMLRTLLFAGTGLLIVGNAAFVYWTVNRLFAPLRKLIDQAKASGLELPEVPEAVSLAPQHDAVANLRDYCARVTQALSTLEAHRLFPEVICQSRRMRNVLTVVQRAAPSETTILLLGESGTGKELVARTIHRSSPRRDGPFVAVNCAAIPASLIESELFGHEKGAFTGAVARREGKFELADGGTILLDEVGELPQDMQAKLLRVLQERVIQRVGGNENIHVNIRVIAATNRDLAALVAAGMFRADLFYRLNVLPIQLPPLRERPEDIPALVRAFITRHTPGKVRMAPETMRFLMAYAWPGNVRELENAVEAALTLGDEEIRPIHLPPQIAPDPERLPVFPENAHHSMKAGLDVSPEDISKSDVGAETARGDIMDNTAPPEATESLALEARLEGVERRAIESALMEAGGVQSQAARLLGIKERSLWHRVKKLGIDVDRFRLV